MSERPTDQELIEEVKSLLEKLRGEFVDRLEPVVSPTARARLLQLYETWRQANLHRIVDLADAAIFMFEQNRLVPGCTLTRGVFETVGVQYYIHKKMVGFTEVSDPESIFKLLLNAVFGRRDDSSWPETAINALTAIDHMDKEFKMLRAEYDHLCEYAHPNMKGGFGAYARQEVCFVRKVCRFAMKGLPKGETGIAYTGKERPSPMTFLHARLLGNAIERKRFTTYPFR
jgi:hypothetical protein